MHILIWCISSERYEIRYSYYSAMLMSFILKMRVE